MIRPWKGIHPRIHPSAFIADTAEVIGDVEIGPESSIWFNTVVRGDVCNIKIGARTNVQDGCVLHVTKTPQRPLILGDDITVGHSVTLHACVIEGPALIGMGAIILDAAVLKPNVIVAAGALVPERMVVEPGTMLMGVPAKPKRKLTEDEIAFLKRSAENYVEYRLDYME
ncbi:MAG: gamma carbonic anhydrase family protein [Nitrospinae bacterium]|nr:gamma carbonic anhydrase family protein [Nitrospinota bacterium]